MSLPEKRDAILYVRIKPVNKEFVEDLADRQEVSEALVVDHIIEEYKNDARNKKKRI